MISLNHVNDFYIMEALTYHASQQSHFEHKWKKFRKDLDKAYFELSSNLAYAMYVYGIMAAMGEARHRSACHDAFILEIENSKSRSDCYAYAKDYHPEKTAQVLTEFFTKYKWSGAYGGQNWGNITNTMLMYGKWSDVAFIDHVVDLQHNTGTVFSKTSTLNYSGFNPEYGEGFVGFNEFLTFKRNKDILFDYYGHYVPITYSTIRLLQRFEFMVGKKIRLSYTPNEEDWSPIPFKFGTKVPKIRWKIDGKEEITASLVRQVLDYSMMPLWFIINNAPALDISTYRLIITKYHMLCDYAYHLFALTPRKTRLYSYLSWRTEFQTRLHEKVDIRKNKLKEVMTIQN